MPTGSRVTTNDYLVYTCVLNNTKYSQGQLTGKLLPMTVQYSHVYVTTPSIQQFLRDQQLQARCQATVALSGTEPFCLLLTSVLNVFMDFLM